MNKFYIYVGNLIQDGKKIRKASSCNFNSLANHLEVLVKKDSKYDGFEIIANKFEKDHNGNLWPSR